MPGIDELKIRSSNNWRQQDFVCGNCGIATHSQVLAWPMVADPLDRRLWIHCASCGAPSVIDRDGAQWPTALAGPSVSRLPDDLDAAYGEARRCVGAGAYTASELMCRKILMYLAIDVAKADEGKSFAHYLDELETAGYVTPPMKPWVKAIKDRGNEATHELPHVTRDRAVSTLELTGRLLALAYETGQLAEELEDAAEQSEAEGAGDGV